MGESVQLRYGKPCQTITREESLVLFIQVLPSERPFLLISLSTRPDVQLVGFDPLSGALCYSGTEGKDVFDTEEGALQHLKLQGECKILGKGKAVLGYVVIGGWGLLLLAENTRVSAELPGGHKIRTVTNIKWHRIPCQAESGEAATGFTREDLEQKISKIIDFPINGAHWFCETADVTRPFPSEHSVSNPCWQFAWNHWLSASFRYVKLHEHCPALLQGTAEVRRLEDVKGQAFNLVLLSRRGRLHPGTRYIARGLNNEGEPGNEIECEQIIWQYGQSEKDPVKWSAYVWRRGTVPIRWGVTIKNSGLGEAEISIRKENTFKGTRKYVRRLQKRFAPNHELERSIMQSVECSETSTSDSGAENGGTQDSPFSAGDASMQYPVVFVSLLRKGTPDRDRSEAKLATAFDHGISLLRRELKLPLTYFALDWHEMDKQLGTEEVIQALWSTMKAVVEEHGFAVGQYDPQDPSAGPGASGAVRTYWNGQPSMSWSCQQKGITRYNCADSLDRTNVASFFMSVQMFVEQCRRLDLHVVTDGEGFTTGERVQRTLRERLLGPSKPPPPKTRAKLDGKKSGGGRWGGRTPSPEPVRPNLARKSPLPRQKKKGTPPEEEIKLPVGWESRRDAVTGMVYYVDHNSKRTTWTPPPSVQQQLEAARKAAEEAAAAAVASQVSMDNGEEEEQGGGLAESLNLQPFELLNSRVDDVRRRVLPEALSTLAEIFLMNGDRNAFFYTGSQAMHSQKIMIFEPETSQLRRAGAGGINNSWIAITRRYNNVVRDNDRQAQIEMFLGINHHKYFKPPNLLPTHKSPLLYPAETLPMECTDTDDEDDHIGRVSFPPPVQCKVQNRRPQRAKTPPVEFQFQHRSTADLHGSASAHQGGGLGVGASGGDLTPKRSLSESNLAAKGLETMADLNVSFRDWSEIDLTDESGTDQGGVGPGNMPKPPPVNNSGENYAKEMEVTSTSTVDDGWAGLREVPVDVSPLSLN